VETIGDAYMVVGGLPTRYDNHAERVCNQALDMMLSCQDVRSPVDGNPINVCTVIIYVWLVIPVYNCVLAYHMMYASDIIQLLLVIMNHNSGS